ncbi:hypothetical protein B0H14DRAFT_3436242 [Mycena olivaceomarginata]|nr:hypothetical protein B0H14DRAFT_3436242 [Mycena olivaceomarginata]
MLRFFHIKQFCEDDMFYDEKLIPAASPSLTPTHDSRKSAIFPQEIQARSPLPSAVLMLILSQKSVRLLLPSELAES